MYIRQIYNQSPRSEKYVTKKPQVRRVPGPEGQRVYHWQTSDNRGQRECTFVEYT